MSLRLQDKVVPPLYLMVREDLFSPVVQSQVFDVMDVVATECGTEVGVLWFCRLDVLARQYRQLGELRKHLASRGIGLHIWPLLAVRFPVHSFLLVPVLLQICLGCVWFWIRHRTAVFHCRSYTSALAATLLARLLPMRIIFDPRSQLPEESVTAGYWSESSMEYRLYKRIESYLARHSDAIVVTSPAMGEAFKSLGAACDVVTIPNNYPISFGRTGKPAEPRSPNGPCLLFGYCGSLGHWNSSAQYISFFERIVDLEPDALLRFVVPRESVSDLRKVIEGRPGVRSRCSVISVRQEEVAIRLEQFDVGLQLMQRRDTRLGIKVVEYLAAGTPVIVSELVCGAASIVEEYGVGFVLRADMANVEDCLRFVRSVRASRREWADHCRTVAGDLFSPHAVAQRLLSVYQSV